MAASSPIPTAAKGRRYPEGAVINTMGSVGDGSDWYTGILVYSKHTGGHNIYFVYTLSHCFCL